MVETIYYEDPDVKVTSACVQGKDAMYPLASVVGVEVRRRTFAIVWFTAIWIFLAVLVFAISSDAPAWVRPVVVLGLAVNSFFLWGNSYVCPMFVRTASGLAPLGAAKFPAARQAIMQAFAEAKSAAR